MGTTERAADLFFVVGVSGAFTMTRVIFSSCFCFGGFVCSNWEKLGGKLCKWMVLIGICRIEGGGMGWVRDDNRQ